MEEEKLRAVYYARCSTEEENQKDALVRQAAEAEEAIRARGWRLVDAYVESRSGTSRKGRWEYNRLYEDLEQNRFDVVVIKSQDRLMRNTRDWYLFADRLNCAGKRLYFQIATGDRVLFSERAIENLPEYILDRAKIGTDECKWEP